MNIEYYNKAVDIMKNNLEIDYNVGVIVVSSPYGESGGASHEHKIIILPDWLDKYDVIYQLYYVIHEFCHVVLEIQHSNRFKELEDRMLNLFGITIVRRAVYPKKLFYKGEEILNIPYNNNS